MTTIQMNKQTITPSAPVVCPTCHVAPQAKVTTYWHTGEHRGRISHHDFTCKQHGLVRLIVDYKEVRS